MRTDLLVQVVLLTTATTAWLTATDWLTYTTLIILWVWQLASAVQLRYGYPHRLRHRFLRIVLLQLPFMLLILAHAPAVMVWLLLASTLLYFAQTLHDWRIVARRPVSFWQLI